MKRVAVTGIGVISPLGNDCRRFFDGLVAGRSAVRLLDTPFSQRLQAPLAASVQFSGEDWFPPARLRMLDRVSQFALAATAQAVAASGMDFSRQDPERAGVFVGTGMGGAQSTDEGYQTLYEAGSDRLKPYSVLLAMNNAAASWIGMEYGLSGPNLTFSTACSSSAVAIGEAWQRIRRGELDVALAGGSEAPLSLGTLKAWEALRTLASVDAADPGASCKPFSADRSGLVLGEGAAMLLLEEWEQAARRGAPILAEVTGYGLTTDGVHLTRPSVEGQARSMRLALASAGNRQAAGGAGMDYVNAHGTGTVANDGTETAALKAVFGEQAPHVPVSSTKAVHGHLLGAAGALEFAAAILALQEGVIPPTMHLHQPDPECDLDYVPHVARSARLQAVMSNSFAFGGTNVSLIAAAV